MAGLIFSLLLLISPSISHAESPHYMISPSGNTVLDKSSNRVNADKGFQILIPSDWIFEGRTFKSIDSSMAILDYSTLFLKTMIRCEDQNLNLLVQPSKVLNILILLIWMVNCMSY